MKKKGRKTPEDLQAMQLMPISHKKNSSSTSVVPWIVQAKSNTGIIVSQMFNFLSVSKKHTTLYQ